MAFAGLVSAYKYMVREDQTLDELSQLVRETTVNTNVKHGYIRH